jgi:hypothetical protein
VNPFGRSFSGDDGEREPIGGMPKRLDFHLKVSDRYVDMLNSLPEFRALTTDELVKLLPAAIRKSVPPVGDDLSIREAAYERETRQRRAVVIGILAKPERIAQHLSQQFAERL